MLYFSLLCHVVAALLSPGLRPDAEGGAGAGEAVCGGEASGSGGAAADVRARAPVSAAAALSGESVSASALQQLPHKHRTQQTAPVERREVRTSSPTHIQINYLVFSAVHYRIEFMAEDICDAALAVVDA